jgi:hypothetical protein
MEPWPLSIARRAATGRRTPQEPALECDALFNLASRRRSFEPSSRIEKLTPSSRLPSTSFSSSPKYAREPKSGREKPTAPTSGCVADRSKNIDVTT